MRKKILSEKNLVVILFVMVFIIFSLAQEDTRKIEQMYLDTNTSATTITLDRIERTEVKGQAAEVREPIPATQLR
jgi:uncharacterized membrane protein